MASTETGYTSAQAADLRGALEDYLRRRGLSTRKPFRCLSPDHEDRHPSMHYNPRAQNVHCFACGITYDLFDLIGMDYGVSSFPQKIAKALELFAPPAPAAALQRREAPTTASSSDTSHPSDHADALEALRAAGTDGSAYLRGRGVTEENCRRFGLFESAGRAYIPVTERGRCTGWIGRALSEEIQPRYRNSAGALGLFGGDRLSENGAGRLLLITEGAIDAILLEQLGACAVALCGAANAGKLLRRLEQSPPTGWRLCAAGDPDAAGQRMNRELIDGLAALGIPCAELPLRPEDGDIGALYQKDRPRLEALLAELVAGAALSVLPAADALDDFFVEMTRRAARPAVSTGLSGLDRLLDGGLHPGLYILGAVAGLGKTSLTLQMAEQMASTGQDVLFFSLEQSRFELMAKGLSRASAELDTPSRRGAFTARHLLAGRPPGGKARTVLLARARAAYAARAGRLYIQDGADEITVREIRSAVEAHRAATGRAPVVVLDYLQILAPEDRRATDKQNTDRAVTALKKISRDFEIPLLVVSSFNRESYRSVAQMESFKESGAVEYSADVLLGLQLTGVGKKNFDADREKLKTPRHVELVLLKNRNGIPSGKVPLLYDARFSLFEEASTAGGSAGLPDLSKSADPELLQ